MTDRKEGFSRRRFLICAGAAGVGSLMASQAGAAPQAQPAPPDGQLSGQVPTRQFGASGRQVSILALGGMFDIAANQLMLRQAIQWGVTYWDTADCYHSGSEAGIGKYFSKYPQDRAKVFLVSKSDARDPEGIGRLLDRSLEKMNTDYIDLYFLHSVKKLDELDDKVRRWAEGAKASRKIRLFGFSTHKNMEQLLLGASKLRWIDGIMSTYNFRIMQSAQMQEAVAACHEAGIGLTAMKTQASGSWFDWSRSDPAAGALAEQLRQKGWSEEQAKLKAVWHNPHIASICSQMDSMRLLKANVEAALDPRPIGSAELRSLAAHARATADQYCLACGACASGLAADLSISDIMRFHMYGRTYGRTEWARQGFAQLSPPVRKALAGADLRAAEACCPQHLPIGRLVAEALDDFA